MASFSTSCRQTKCSVKRDAETCFPPFGQQVAYLSKTLASAARPDCFTFPIRSLGKHLRRQTEPGVLPSPREASRTLTAWGTPRRQRRRVNPRIRTPSSPPAVLQRFLSLFCPWTTPAEYGELFWAGCTVTVSVRSSFPWCQCTRRTARHIHFERAAIAPSASQPPLVKPAVAVQRSPRGVMRTVHPAHVRGTVHVYGARAGRTCRTSCTRHVTSGRTLTALSVE